MRKIQITIDTYWPDCYGISPEYVRTTLEQAAQRMATASTTQVTSVVDDRSLPDPVWVSSDEFDAAALATWRARAVVS
jgi:hypothetical protein